jgi:uncharacterized short protein YbdD (DUF466 family)
MQSAWRAFSGLAGTIWMRLREWCGDAAYERYQRAVLRQSGKLPVTRERFYLEQLERRYSRPNRCC